MKIILRTINGDVKVVYDSEVKPAEGENITVGEGEQTAIYKVLGGYSQCKFKAYL